LSQIKPLLGLPDITLVAQFGTCHELTIAAVLECTKRARFAEVDLFTDRPDHPAIAKIGNSPHSGVCIWPAGPFKSLEDSARFSTYELPKHIDTSHALFIHYDSWVVNPSAWTDEFLEYDYVGAPWFWFPDKNVGNSGFCLRSRRLMDFMVTHADEFPLAMPEDVTLCRSYRPALERHGFRFAPVGLAGRFSFERAAYWSHDEIFGFHGLFNWPLVLNEAEISERLKDAPRYVLESQHYKELRAFLARRQQH
jgi:hypothetical protein